MTIKYHVRLSAEERVMLEALVKQEKPKGAQQKKRKANILLAIDEDHDPLQHDQVAKAFHIKPVTITRLRQRFVEEARRIADKFEMHYTPTHGSWLDMAEIELSILSRQCLGRQAQQE